MILNDKGEPLVEFYRKGEQLIGWLVRSVPGEFSVRVIPTTVEPNYATFKGIEYKYLFPRSGTLEDYIELTSDTLPSNKDNEPSILDKAKAILEGSRNSDYGGTEGLNRIAKVASILTNIDLTAEDIAKIMISLKLVRESFNHKEDNILDGIGYLALLNDIYNERDRN